MGLKINQKQLKGPALSMRGTEPSRNGWWGWFHLWRKSGKQGEGWCARCDGDWELYLSLREYNLTDIDSAQMGVQQAELVMSLLLRTCCPQTYMAFALTLSWAERAAKDIDMNSLTLTRANVYGRAMLSTATIKYQELRILQKGNNIFTKVERIIFAKSHYRPLNLIGNSRQTCVDD